MPKIPSHHSIIQTAWVVNDLEEAARRWHRTMGIGPFVVSRNIQVKDALHRSAPSNVDFSTAIAQAGPVQVELVVQHNDAPSCYRDTVSAGTEAMHHVAIIADCYDDVVESYTAQGHEIASSGIFGGTRFCYVDCTATIGHMVEILEDKPVIRNFFAAIKKAAETWDGDPEKLLQ